ncbi:hypothetical protein ACCUM_2196 [Candidatus Accumulibacter phosphatis]|uniref:Uncharacterized protein n=1 Tax=Candidatus Accumulibacter phosphatis TaxID=327160 RepID=A0A5S4F2M2_9PROT|nr:hypothetical protein ACCUM_2196 [Candidatus Accumulibacter phosphatis]
MKGNLGCDDWSQGKVSFAIDAFVTSNASYSYSFKPKMLQEIGTKPLERFGGECLPLYE